MQPTILLKTAIILLLLAGCSTPSSFVPVTVKPYKPARTATTTKPSGARLHVIPDNSHKMHPKATEVVMYAMNLLDIGYVFGGSNPAAGLDCSGMASYIYKEAAGIRLPHHAASIAKMGRGIAYKDLRPGDLVFFNTLGRPYSHMGIYIGEGRFIHAPHTNSQIKKDSLTHGYFAQRLEAARTFFD